MKKLTIVCGLFCLLFSLPSLAQEKDSVRWNQIDSLAEKGLYKSALQQTETLYAKAAKSDDQPLEIKALIYQLKFRDQLQEDATQKNIDFLQEKVNEANFPVKAVLQSMLAEMYWHYLQQNRYKFYQRTPIASDTSENDIAQWTLERLQQKIGSLYAQSIAQAEALKKIDISRYQPVLLKPENTKGLWPTLYDLLTQRGLEYYTNDENNINQPEQVFEINQPAAFADAAAFAKANFSSPDSASLSYKALLLYQDLLGFHLNDQNPDALIDADISRLQYVYQHAVLANKDSLYIKALSNLQNQYPDNPVVAQAAYLRAQYYTDLGNQYQSLTDSAHQYDLVKAKRICQDVINKFPKSLGEVNCHNLSAQLQRTEINIEAEKVNLPGDPIRALVTYKNVSKLYLRIIPVDAQVDDLSNNLYDDTCWKKLAAIRPLKSWQQGLPDEHDLQRHSVEIKIDALPTGKYLLITSEKADFSKHDNLLSMQQFWVSNLSYVSLNNSDYFLINRRDGEPIEGAHINVLERTTYNQQHRRWSYQKIQELTSDAQGYFTLKDTRGKYKNSPLPMPRRYTNLPSKNVQFDIHYKKDSLNLGDEFVIYHTQLSNKPEKEDSEPVVYYFTDRSIYRPGQTVYFKGLVVRKNKTRQPEIITGIKDTIYLRDANNNNIDSLEVNSNAYGSFHGSFTLPQNALTGVFSVCDAEIKGKTEFSVEEYKRPKFYVQLDTLKSSYRLYDTVHISGSAKAYSGVNINDAKVEYHVQRQAVYPLYYRYYRPFMPPSQQREIAHGSVQTDAKGKFNFNFPALPDESADSSFQPVFNYVVNVSVTDINGETRSSSTTVSAAYHALELSIPLADMLSVDSLQAIPVEAKNLSGQPQKVLTHISIEALQPPQRLLRERYWQQPDEFVMSKAEYIKNFPHDIYKNENEVIAWSVKDTVLKQDFETGNNQPLSLANKLPQGWYKITANATDQYGQPIKTIKFLQLIDPNDKQLIYPQYAWQWQQDTTLRDGEKGNVFIGSSADNHIIKAVETADQEPQFSWINLKKGVNRQSFDIDSAALEYAYIWVKDNRVYLKDGTFNYTSDHQLDISFNTFRNKVLPGTKEQWQLHIGGSGNQNTDAEMLASMYDVSLDQFKPHDWSWQNIWPQQNLPEMNWQTNDGFGTNGSSIFIDNNEKYISYNIQYPQLNWFGYVGNYRTVEKALQGRVAGITLRGKSTLNQSGDPNGIDPGLVSDNALSEAVVVGYGTAKTTTENTAIQPRKNLQETAFFYPQLHTDSAGNINLDFTMPEALTTWRLMTLAHTKDLQLGYAERQVMTQKKLMVLPNLPRFLRAGDAIVLSAKIANLSDSAFAGTASLELLDAATMQPVDTAFYNQQAEQSFQANKGESAVVNWALKIPDNFKEPVIVKIIARSGRYSDGEQDILPLLPDRMLVTETLPLQINNEKSKSYTFDHLLQSGKSSTLQNVGLTVEFTTNPSWYAIKALPYLMEFPHECAEQTFERFYANLLAAHILNAYPKIKTIFEKWQQDSSALNSELEKNQQLKSVLLAATPWLEEAKNEKEERKRLADLFDPMRVLQSTNRAADELDDMQDEDGSFPWFKGMYADRYITQYILSGIGHLKTLGINEIDDYPEMKSIPKKALAYLDKQILTDYKRDTVGKNDHQIDPEEVQYLYMRSSFQEISIADSIMPAVQYFRQLAAKQWTQQSKQLQAMIALEAFRNHQQALANDIIKSLKETAIRNEETGVHWKEMDRPAYYWSQVPIQTEALIMEAFKNISPDNDLITGMKQWLLSQKQTQNWPSTIATADACYALLLTGQNWLAENNQPVKITLGQQTINSADEPQEAGTGYFEKHFDGKAINSQMGNIKVQRQSSSSQPAWGAVYWQYFEQLDKINADNASPFQLQKQLYLVENTSRGEQLKAITANAPLNIGDKVRVRLVIKSKRDMDYVQLKDMRAGCFEPVDVLSGMQYQDGLSYYQSTLDASTNFFLDHLNRGTYVLEYDLNVMAAGTYSNGISSLQCMYAPAFSSHTKGIMVRVE